ncbi:uncharacterized protein [Miscanthus floridulus]|uniref:uncharacterized protein n=1 Tax=Miscanthus floridulus TaxID=154761 RepID=UPI0034581692
MEEEDEVEEIEHEESRPQAIRILRKRGEEVVVMEEDTTREVKRLWHSAHCVQWQQVIKRMEPLVEENKKLKEAVKLMEKNLEHTFEQLRSSAEQLRNVSEQKKEQDAELGRLRQVTGQLQEELIEDLKEYRQRTKVQFDMLELEART